MALHRTPRFLNFVKNQVPGLILQGTKMDPRPSCSKTYGKKETIPPQHVAEQGFANAPPASGNSRPPPKVAKRRIARASKAVGTADTQVLQDVDVPGPSSEQSMIFPVTDSGKVKFPKERRLTEHAEHEAEQGFANAPPESGNSRPPPKVAKRRIPRTSKAVGTTDTQVLQDVDVPGPSSEQCMIFPVTDPGKVKFPKERRLTEHAEHVAEQGFANAPPTSGNSRPLPKVAKRRIPRTSKAVGTTDTQVLQDVDVPGPSSEQRMIFPVTDPGNVKFPKERRLTAHPELQELEKRDDFLLPDRNTLLPSSNRRVRYKTSDVRKILNSNSRCAKQAERVARQNNRSFAGAGILSPFPVRREYKIPKIGRVAPDPQHAARQHPQMLGRPNVLQPFDEVPYNARTPGVTEITQNAQNTVRQDPQVFDCREVSWKSNINRVPHKNDDVQEDPEILRTNMIANDIQRALKLSARMGRDGNRPRPYSTQEVFRSVAQAKEAQIPGTSGTAENAQNIATQISQIVRNGNLSPPHSTQEVSRSVAEVEVPQTPSTGGTSENAQNTLEQTSHIIRDGNVSQPHSTQEASRGVAEAQGPKVTSTGGTVKKTQNTLEQTSHIVGDGNVSPAHSTQEVLHSVAEAQIPQIPSTSGTSENAQNTLEQTSHIIRDGNVSQPHSTQEVSHSVAQKPQATSTTGTVKKPQNAARPTSQILREWNASRRHRTQKASRVVAEAQRPQIPSTSGTSENAQNTLEQASHIVGDGNVSPPHSAQEVSHSVAETQIPQIPSTSGTSENAQRQPDHEILGLGRDSKGTPYLKVVKNNIKLVATIDTINEGLGIKDVQKSVKRCELHSIPLRSLKVGRSSLLFDPEELRKKIKYCNRIIDVAMNKKARMQQIEEAKSQQSSDDSCEDSDESVIYETYPRVQVDGKMIIYNNPDDVSTSNTVINGNSDDRITVNRDPLAINGAPHEDTDALPITSGNKDIYPDGKLTINDNLDPEDAPADTYDPVGDTHASLMNIDPDDQLTLNDNPDLDDAPVDTYDPVGDTHASLMNIDPDDQLTLNDNPDLDDAPADTYDPVGDTHASLMNIDPDDQLTLNDNPDLDDAPADTYDPVGDTHASLMNIDPDDQLTLNDNPDLDDAPADTYDPVGHTHASLMNRSR